VPHRLAVRATSGFEQLARIASNRLAFLLDESDKSLERGGLRVLAPSQYQIGLVVIVLQAKETDSYGALIQGARRDQCDALTCGDHREQGLVLLERVDNLGA
jgi:hypothetical protein